MRVYKNFAILLSLLIFYLTIYTSCWLQSYILFYISMLGFSISLSLLLRKANITQKYASAILGLTLALSLRCILARTIVDPYPVLVWDNKARSNVVEFIIRNGYYPFDLAGFQSFMYRDEYILYPTAFILAAMTSLITSLNVTEIFLSPIIIFALLVVFVVLSILLMKRNKLLGWIAAASLSLNFVTIGYIYPYIYSQVARAFIALLFYMVLVKKTGKSTSFSDLFVCLVFTALIPVTHSSESIAFFTAITMLSLTLTLKNFMFRNRESRHSIFFKLFTVYLVTLLIWNIFQAQYMAQSIYNMLLRSFEYALKTEITESATRFTPFDYTLSEMLTIISGFLAYGVILLILAFDTLVSSLKRKRKHQKTENTIIVVLILIIIMNAFIYLKTPYKSDITWRFVFIFFVLAGTFLTNKRKIYTKCIRQFWYSREILFAVLLGITISSMYLYLRFQNINSDYDIFSLNIRHALDDSKIIEFLKESKLNEYSNVFVDSPSMPYYIFRDYITVRIPVMRYIIVVDNPHIQYYKFRLLSGIQLYRFVLLRPYIEISNLHTSVDKAIIFYEPSSINVCKIFNMLYNSGSFALSVTY